MNDMEIARRQLYTAELTEAKPVPPPHVKAAYDQLDSEHKAASKALKAIPGVDSGPMGLTPDHVKSSSEYKAAKQKSDNAFRAIQNFNKQHATKYDWRKYK